MVSPTVPLPWLAVFEVPVGNEGREIIELMQLCHLIQLYRPPSSVIYGPIYGAAAILSGKK